MTSAFAYGSNLLSGDIGANLGQSYGAPGPLAWNNLELGLDGGSNKNPAGNLGEFIRLVTHETPKGPEPAAKKPMRQVLGGESPQTSPGSSSAHLSQSVLQITATSLRADMVVVAVLHPSNRLLAHQHPSRLAETVIATPRVKIPEAVSFSHEMLRALTGQVVSTEDWSLPSSLVDCIGQKPSRFQGSLLQLEEYEGVVYALWVDPSHVPYSAPLVMANAVRSLPLLLANRASARKSERLGRQFDAILKRMPQAVVFVDDELAQVVVNPAAAELLELPCFGEVDPVKVAGSMRHLAERSGCRSDLQRWFSMVAGMADSIIEEEWELTDPRRVLRVQSYPVSSNVNAAHGRLWLFEDLTAERNAREAIAAANHAKSQFLAMMSHELRTPMTGVLGMLDLLKLTPMEKEQLQLLKVMQSSAEGLMTVINNILDFCKMEAGRLMLEEIDFQVNDLLDKVRIIHERELEEKQLQLQIMPPPAPHQALRGDPVRLKQIVANLVNNAIKNTDRGTVIVSWQPSDPPEPTPVLVIPERTTPVQWGRERKYHYYGGSPAAMSIDDRLSSWQASEFAGLSRAGSAEVGAAGGSSSATSRSSSPRDNASAELPASPPWNPLQRASTVTGPVRMQSGVQEELLEDASMDSPRMAESRDYEAAVPDVTTCVSCGVACQPGAATSAYPMVVAGSMQVPLGDDLGPKKGVLCSSCQMWRAGSGGLVRLRSQQRQEQEEAEGSAGSMDEDQERDPRQWFRVTITDTGCGMSADQLQKALEGSQTTGQRREQDGSGLGLPICRGLLSLMGGRIWATSEVGVGSQFIAMVPLLPAENQQVAAGETGTPPGSVEASHATAAQPSSSPTGTGVWPGPVPQDLKLKVLVAEDNKVNQLLIRKILKHYGHEVELVGNGKLALEAVQAQPYDMVLMDLQMPILDGLNATRAIRSLSTEVSKIPIYALTADAMAPEIEEAGMDGFLSKPIAWDKLSHVVDQILVKKASNGQAP